VSPKLVLFDIDGTLVLTGGAGMHALNRVLSEAIGVAEGLDGVPLAGRTDRAIIADVLARHDRRDLLDDRILEAFCGDYFRYLEEEMAKDLPGKRMLPGVESLLETLAARPDVELALLTGNLQEGARLKLSHFDLWRYFSWGAFGGDSVDRNELFPVAMAKARERGVAPSPRDVFVIGDTPHDVACARAGNARAIAVATGPYPVDALVATGADLVLPDLSDARPVLEFIA
jgi:phosphoglycolate phosphatase-like HAD superfamily hydrolase